MVAPRQKIVAMPMHQAPLGAPTCAFLVCSTLAQRNSKTPQSASLRFNFFILVIFIAFSEPCAKRAGSEVVRAFQTKGCSCAAGRLFLVAFVALARSNELVRSCGGENHPFDDCLPIFDCRSAGLSWFRAPAAATSSTGRARAWASSPRSSRFYIAGYRLMQYFTDYIFRLFEVKK